MGLKFLNKKGWHTGSFRNIEKVWKAEQKEVEEKKKLEELKKQIAADREAEEFQKLREQAGLAPFTQRVDFLYESGLATGKGEAEDLMSKKITLSGPKQPDLSQTSSTPGALFSTDPSMAAASTSAVAGTAGGGIPAVSANEMWRRLHSDPLLLIRQQEQAALARIKSNPVKMEQLRKQAEVEKQKKQEKKDKKERKEKRKEKKRKKERKEEKKKSRKEREKTDSTESSEGEDEGGDLHQNKASRDEEEDGIRDGRVGSDKREGERQEGERKRVRADAQESTREQWRGGERGRGRGADDDDGDYGRRRGRDTRVAERENDREWDRERFEDRERGREGVGERERARNTEREWERERDRDRDGHRDRNVDWGRSRGMDMAVDGDRDRDRDRDRVGGRQWDGSKRGEDEERRERGYRSKGSRAWEVTRRDDEQESEGKRQKNDERRREGDEGGSMAKRGRHNSPDEEREGRERMRERKEGGGGDPVKERAGRGHGDTPRKSMEKDNDQQQEMTDRNQQQQHSGRQHDSEGEEEEKRRVRGDCGGEGEVKYGLSFSQRAALVGRHKPMGDKREERQGEVREEGKSDSKQVAAGAGGERDEGRVRVVKRAGRMSEEEKKQRLAEMMAEAANADREREERLQWAAKKEEEEEERDKERSSTGRFLRDAELDVYGAGSADRSGGAGLVAGGSSSGGGDQRTVEESIRRRSHFLQRGGAAETRAFRR